MAYTTIDDPSAYFQTKIYTGNGGSLAVTNDGNADLQPDWVWFKKRGGSEGHALFDTSRGIDRFLITNSTAVEQHQPTNGNTDADDIASFDSDGFTFQGGGGAINQSSNTYVAWQWKANGGTTSSNSDGDITSTVQANTTAGFSIVTYTGNGTDGASIGHGLSGAWDVIIVKNRDATDYWTVDREPTNANNKALLLHDPSPQAGHGTIHFQGSNGLFTAHSNDDLTMGNGSGEKYVAYVFKQIQGFSSFGEFKGNGNADGPMVFCGFSPSWVMIKNTADSTNWNIYDNKRSTFNTVDDILMANATDAEGAVGGKSIDFLSNGFKLRGSDNETNDNGDVHFYMAFAEHPFVSSEGVPTTAR